MGVFMPVPTIRWTPLPVSMDAPNAASMLKLDGDCNGVGDEGCESVGGMGDLDREREVKIDCADFLERKPGLLLLLSVPLADPGGERVAGAAVEVVKTDAASLSVVLA